MLIFAGDKMGATPGSFTHTTEFFGPVLGVMCAESGPGDRLGQRDSYGLTSGLKLDSREQAHWRQYSCRQS